MCLVNELARFNKIQPEYKLLCEQGPAHSKVTAAIDFLCRKPETRVTTGRVYAYLVPEASSCLCVCSLPQMFSVRLTLGDQRWEAEGTSIKKAQHSAAASALAQTTLPKPSMRSPRNTGKNPNALFQEADPACACVCVCSVLSHIFYIISNTFVNNPGFCFVLGGGGGIFVVDCMTHTMELNALCMKLGKKPIYKPIDPYPGMRPSLNCNIRHRGPYQRSMQQ